MEWTYLEGRTGSYSWVFGRTLDRKPREGFANDVGRGIKRRYLGEKMKRWCS